MDRLTRLMTGGGEKQSRAGFLAQIAKLSLASAAIVSGLSLSVANAAGDCCGSAGCSSGYPLCANNTPPAGYIFEDSCTCCYGGSCNGTTCGVWKDPNSGTTCHTYTGNSNICPCVGSGR